MKTLAVLLAAGLLVLSGCGGDEEAAAPSGQEVGGSATEEPDVREGAQVDGDGGDAAMAKAGKGTTLIAADSEFGEMLFDAGKQAIYIFENDSKGKSRCYGECAEAWPPVFADGEPVAGDGVDAELLGTTERRDGKLQVTYGGKPLYYYAHEAPGEVRCHNVDLNGGLWWVVGPDGERRP